MGKSKQKISNWKLYNLALVKRGSLTLWMDEQAIKHWHCQTHHGRRGRGFHYSDRAIDTAQCQCLIACSSIQRVREPRFTKARLYSFQLLIFCLDFPI